MACNYFKRTAESQYPHRIRRWLENFWWEHSGDIGLFLWMIVGLIVGAELWFLYGSWPR